MSGIQRCVAVLKNVCCIGVSLFAFFAVPMAGIAELPTSTVYNAMNTISSVDWSPADRYIAIAAPNVSLVVDDLRILKFQTNNLVLSQEVDMGTTQCLAVRWHATQHYLAAGKANGAGSELVVYYMNSSTAAFISTNQMEIGASVNAMAWNPKNNYLAVGTDNGSEELQVYNYPPGALALVDSENITSTRTVQPNALAWHPNGSNLVVGLDASATTPFMHYRLVNNSLTKVGATGAVDPAPWGAFSYAGTAAAWSRDGSILAVGGTRITGTNKLQLFTYVSSNSALTLITGSVESVSLDVTSLHWSPIGDILIAGLSKTSTESKFRAFRYIREEQRLVLLEENYLSAQSSVPVNDVRWSRDSRFIATAEGEIAATQLKVLRYELADLKIAKVANPELVTIGTNVDYTISIQNLGPDAAISVTVTDTLPSSVEFVEASISTNAYWLSNNVFSVQGIGTLNSGSSTSITLTVTVLSNAVSVITNSAVVTAFTTDPELSNNIAFAFNYFDSDGDGFGDPFDNCPTNYNPDQTDSDLDGYGDDCDNCVSVANTNQFDIDFDGVGDACDNCLTNANPDQADFDMDGYGNVCDPCPTNYTTVISDVDADGVGDECDNCPTNYNPYTVVEIDGTNYYFQSDIDADGIGDVCDSDMDGDLLPNDWEAQYGFDFFNPNNPDTYLDPDMDGQSNLDELITDTNPTNEFSYARVSDLSVGSQPIISWASSSGRYYDVYYFTNLLNTNMTIIYQNVLSTGAIMSVVDTNHTGGTKFYDYKTDLVP